MAYEERNAAGSVIRLYVTPSELAAIKRSFPVVTEEHNKAHTLYGVEIVVSKYAAPPPKPAPDVLDAEVSSAPGYPRSFWGRVRWHLYGGWLALQLGVYSVAQWALRHLLILIFKLNQFFLRKGSH